MSDSGTGEKTEEPTPERLRKLRRDGSVPKSQDVTSSVAFLGVFCVIAFCMPFITDQMLGFVRNMVALMNSTENTGVIVSNALYDGLWTLTKVIGPAIVCAFILSLALNLAQVGFLFSTKPITPDLKKINPVQGFKNIFNMKKVVELTKTVIKFTLISYLSYAALQETMRDVVLMVCSDVVSGIKVIGTIVWKFCLQIGGVFIVIAAFDAFYQKKRYMKDNRMSKYDVKQEYKQTEGDPQLKAERKQLHREMANSVGSVKDADVVIRNPDHIAIALKYDRDGDGEEKQAPSVVAKGMRVWAEKILEEAKHYGIPVVRNVPLAHALNKVELGEEIPEELYDAVAEVLNFVYELAEEQKSK